MLLAFLATVNIQYQIKESLEVLLITNEEKQLPKGVFIGSQFNAFVGRKVITTSLDTKENILKTNKLVGITEIVISLEELDNTENLESGRLSRILHYVTLS